MVRKKSPQFEEAYRIYKEMQKSIKRHGFVTVNRIAFLWTKAMLEQFSNAFAAASKFVPDQRVIYWWRGHAFQGSFGSFIDRTKEECWIVGEGNYTYKILRQQIAPYVDPKVIKREMDSAKQVMYLQIP